MTRHAWLSLGSVFAVACVAALACSNSDDDGGSAQPAPADDAGGAAGSDSGFSLGGGGTGGAAGSVGDAATTDSSSACTGRKTLDFGTPCNTCADKACCKELTACEAVADCVKMTACVLKCPQDDAGVWQKTCVDTCGASAPGNFPYYNQMLACLGDTDGGQSCGATCPF